MNPDQLLDIQHATQAAESAMKACYQRGVELSSVKAYGIMKNMSEEYQTDFDLTKKYFNTLRKKELNLFDYELPKTIDPDKVLIAESMRRGFYGTNTIYNEMAKNFLSGTPMSVKQKEIAFVKLHKAWFFKQYVKLLQSTKSWDLTELNAVIAMLMSCYYEPEFMVVK